MEDEDDTDENTENVCGHYLEHAEVDGLGCCRRCGAEMEPEEETVKLAKSPAEE